MLPEAKTGQNAQNDVDQISDQEREPRHGPVYVLGVEVRVVYGQVPLHGHCAQDGHPGRAEEEHGEGEEVAQQRSSWPAAGHVGGDDHGAGETGAQQVSDGHATHQGVEGGFLLLLLGDTQHGYGDEVPQDSHGEHRGRSDQRLGLEPQRALVAAEGERTKSFRDIDIQFRQNESVVDHSFKGGLELRGVWVSVLYWK